MHYDCLIVDDEVELAQMTCECFQMFDVSCTWTADAKACLQLLAQHEIALLLLGRETPRSRSGSRPSGEPDICWR